MERLPVIDAHVHFFAKPALRYGWLAEVPAIDRPYGLADFDADCTGVLVERLVFVEAAVDPGLHLAEARHVQAMADADPRIAAIITHAPVEKGGAVEDELDALARLPRLRGIRRLIQGAPDPGFCLEPDFLEGVKRVGARGLTFDLCVKSWALGYVLELARRCPQVNFVLDHIGKPDIRHGLVEPWRQLLRELGALPNVTCKLSGVITEARQPDWTVEQLRPYVWHAIDCFGFDRLMYGSDWPVGALSHRYADWVAILEELIAGCTAAERSALFHDTAARVYGLER
jgi:L-fuconolactonase